MSENEAREWIMVATETVAQLPGTFLNEACKLARHTCTHHSKIVPCVVAEVERLTRHAEAMQKLERDRLRLALPSTEKRLALPPITQADVDKMSDTLLNIGLAAGALIRNSDGSVIPAVPDIEP